MQSRYPEYKNIHWPQLAQEVLHTWQAERTFEQTLQARKNAQPWVFYEGPPSANGQPGIHHVMGRTIKDIFCRFQSARGFLVERKAGWDTHGLPVELGVEKELCITKEDIGKTITIEAYNEACRTAVMKYTDRWEDLTTRMGYWVDMQHPYVTYHTKYMETVWWLLGQLYAKNLLYKGYTIQPYSPKAGTGLSSHELNQPGTYRDVKDTTVVALFALHETPAKQALLGEHPVHAMAWTTTPWTLPSNTALTVGPAIAYLVVRTRNPYTEVEQRVLLAADLFTRYFVADHTPVPGEEQHMPEGGKLVDKGRVTEWSVERRVTGTQLLNLTYAQLLPYALPHQDADKAFRIITGDFVTTEDGTGIVHTAPTFGADDMKAAREHGVPPMLVLDDAGNPVPLVDLQGRFTAHMGDLAGKYVKNEYYADGEAPERSVDVEIAIRLKEEGKAFRVEKYEHPYPHCWRTDKPVLYYPLDSWFIRSTAAKDRLQELNNTIRWKPASTGTGRFGNWLENLNDWNLSRSRFWGIPLPIWRTEDGKETRVINSVAELREALEQSVAAGHMDVNPLAHFRPGDMSEDNYNAVDLHRPYADRWVLTSSAGQPMYREPDLIDVWFDSGAMPYAQLHYPFENKDLVDQNQAFPADFIAEGVDQTRGWFFTLHAIAGMVFDQVAYTSVVSNGLVLDKNGQKMSKRLGNAIDPFTTLEQYGPDAVRWYMISNAQPWDNLKFDLEGVAEVQRKFFGTLANTYAFLALYANIDNYRPGTPVKWEDRPEIDRWILSELQTLILTCTDAFEAYEPTRAARAMQHFTGEYLSNWYVRLSRRRFWKGEAGLDKESAFQTLYTCLETLAVLMAPIAPFYADRLYRDLHTGAGRPATSVHLADWPAAQQAWVNADLERRMELAQSITSLVLSVRKRDKLKVRQPLARMMVPAADERQRADLLAVQDLILAEVNVKEMVVLEPGDPTLVKQAKPNFKVLGPRYGQAMKAIQEWSRTASQDAIAHYEQHGRLELQLGGQAVVLEAGDLDVLAQDVPGWTIASEGGLTVALDLALTDALVLEGKARELVNRIQNLRKDSGLEVTDRIVVRMLPAAGVDELLKSHGDYIARETLALHILQDASATGTAVDIDGINMTINLQKA